MAVESKRLDAICARVLGQGQPVAVRMRSIFALKSHEGPRAVETLAASMRGDSSILVKHEAAYCLGQMRDVSALPHLEESLRDEVEDAVVRHEAAEAMGAIGDSSVLPVLDAFSDDTHPVEVYETCRLSASRIRLIQGAKNSGGAAKAAEGEADSAAAFGSVDPAPPLAASGKELSVAGLCTTLCDASLDMFERYRAMFALRNVGGGDAVQALCEGMRSDSKSALFRHEVAFVLGQLQSPESVSTLSEFLQDTSEHEMVRHEAAEALGSIATPESRDILWRFRADANAVVRESVAVALDIADYNCNEDAFHYADTASAPAAASAVNAQKVKS